MTPTYTADLWKHRANFLLTRTDMSSSMSNSIEHIATDWHPDSLANAGGSSLPFSPGFALEPVHFHPQPTARWDENPLLEEAASFSVEDQSSHTPSEEENLKSIRYSCPYRKRNPGIFNVRDYPACAGRSFSTIPLLKQHIKTAHMLADFDKKCVSCGAWFRDDKAFGTHLSTKMCTKLPRPQVYGYDFGITKDVEDLLRDRRQKNQVLTWDGIWRTIFPGCTGVPDPSHHAFADNNEAEEPFKMDLSPFSAGNPVGVERISEDSNYRPLLNELGFYDAPMLDHPHRDQPAQHHVSQSRHLKRDHSTFLSGSPPDPTGDDLPPSLGKGKITGDTSYSCPYRKCNPTVFNVRDHPACATRSFPSINLVKRHVLNAHLLDQYNEQCPACLSWFRSQSALSSHSKNGICPKSCRSSTTKLDMGISEETADKLRQRRASRQVLTWDDLWTTLFPGRADVPNREFVPVIEGPEAIDLFRKSLAETDGLASQHAWDLLGSSCGDVGRALRDLYGLMMEGRSKESNASYRIER
ncbi:hypothetical protein NM208_g2509 [Fusarium decemcellulare]|uniref:Uncharacterized protein n=1 Tax=Fusarium decemcellulare TaxID=57161 RepID=A0ACC1SSH6_9HYPO|nr:hypothetical protein NM208_g2509 [Fusarium decemcellulare]